MVSAANDQTLKLWNASGQCEATVCGVAEFRCVAMAEDVIVAGDDMGNIWILEIRREAGAM